MVLHVLRKDWRLLWPLVAALAALQGLLALARFDGGHFFSNGFPTTPAAFLELLAAATVMTLVVLQDPIPGTRQDWLVRPIPRRDFFVAKLLFVLVFVQAPWWLTDVLQGLANGFAVRQSMTAASACTSWVLLTMTLPVLAFASLTATLTETFVAALGVFAIVMGFLIVPGLTGATRPAALTGFAWVTALLREAVLLAAAAGVLVLQYRWRRTWPARALFAAALVTGLLASFLPWRTVFRLQQVLTASSPDVGPRAGDGGSAGDGAGSVGLSFAPNAGRFRLAPGQRLDDIAEKPGIGPVDAAEETERRRAEGARTVFLPMRVAGLPANSRLLADRSEMTLIDRDGRVLHRGTGNVFELRATSANTVVHHGIRVPGALYGHVKEAPLDIHLDYWFTVFRTAATYALPARDGDQRMPEIGWCATKVDDAGSHILFQCLQPGERPSCVAAVLEHTPTGQRNPEVSLCAPEYTPLPGHTFPDAIGRFGGRLPFFDPSGATRYPVGGPQLADARVLVTLFQPALHFVRRVVIRNLRLRDWEPASE